MTDYVLEDASAQDVIDALRFALMAQKDPERIRHLVQALLDLAPETDSDKGIALILALLAEGALKVEMAA